MMEHIENGMAHILSCIHHIMPSFPYSQSNLTMNQVKELLKQSTPPPDCEIDTDDGMYTTEPDEKLICINEGPNKETIIIINSSLI